MPDAGYIGEFIVQAGNGQLPAGTALPIPAEGILGSLRVCDVVIPADGVAGKHASLSFRNGVGMLAEPFFKEAISADGVVAEKRGQILTLHHGSYLTVGDVTLRMRLFIGVDAPMPAAAGGFADDFLQDEKERRE